MNEPIYVNNAGIMLLSPFFSRLFYILNYLNDTRQMENKNKIRAIFVLQYIIYGEEKSYQEAELALTKLLVGWNNEQPLPKKITLTDKEIEMADNLLLSAKGMWEKMRNTSEMVFREAFLQRGGELMYDEYANKWNITVEEKAYDILLDTLPWSFRVVNSPWTNYLLIVRWRDR